MTTLEKIFIEVSAICLIFGAIYSGEYTSLETELNKIRNTTVVEKIDLSEGKSTRNFKNIFGQTIENGGYTPLNVYYVPETESDVNIIKYDNKSILVNTGKRSDAEKLTQFMKAIGVSKIDYVIITFSSPENIEGFAYIKSNFEIGEVIYPDIDMNTKEYNNFKDVLFKGKVKRKKVEIGEKITLGRGKIHISNVINNSNLKNKKDGAICFTFEFEEKKILFIGEITKERLHHVELSDIDVLKIPNFGSDESNSRELYSKTKPEFIISVQTKDKTFSSNVKGILREILEEQKKKKADNNVAFEDITKILQANDKHILQLTYDQAFHAEGIENVFYK